MRQYRAFQNVQVKIFFSNEEAKPNMEHFHPFEKVPSIYTNICEYNGVIQNRKLGDAMLLRIPCLMRTGVGKNRMHAPSIGVGEGVAL